MNKEKMLYKVLKKMDYKQLNKFSEHIRKTIYKVVYNSNGHLASNLGIVELTLALYRIYNPEKDVIIWDTSHQSYVHKMLTGRWEAFQKIRTKEGISGFTNLKESYVDRFGTGHAGTSISAALGYSLGDKIKNNKRDIISIIGDGAFTCGMALESLNQLKFHNANVKIILNTNDMAIAPSVGSLSKILSKVRVKDKYNTTKKFIKNILNETELGHDIEVKLKRFKDGLKYAVYNEPVGFFEDMGIKYFGPVDGHNIEELELFIKNLKNYDESPAVLHVLTTKGKGIKDIEKEPIKYHGISVNNNEGVSYSTIVGKTLAHLKNYNFVTLTAAMPDGTGLNELMKVKPEKVIDLGITEPTVVTAAAAIFLTGTMPIVDIYSSFMQRSYDSIIHDVALQGINVMFLLDRAGLVGEDGATHHGVYDISFLRPIPNIEILTPTDGQDLANMIYSGIIRGISKPTFIRFPKEKEVKNINYIIDDLALVDKSWRYVKKSNTRIFVLAVGTMVNIVRKALVDEDVNIIAIRSVKPIDSNFYFEIQNKADSIFVYEEGSIKGGFNEEIKNMRNKKIYSFGIKDDFISHGTREELLEITELDEKSIKNNYIKIIKKERMKI